ncbi:unnamed protein product [Rhizoctonia solani]|uniref:Uncharacterized protein n=1 Tax=Rhizoctonia solani TaxID=456999 RepID=A0A8H3DLI8_9AGAM
MIMLLPSGTDDNITEWAINPSGPDVYVVHPPPETGHGNIYWTATDISGPIVLEGLEGKPTQHWTFKWEGVEPAIPV